MILMFLQMRTLEWLDASSRIEDVGFLPVDLALAPPTNNVQFQFPTTRFTPHVQGIVDLVSNTTLITPKMQKLKHKTIFNYDPHMYCKESFRISIERPFSTPNRIECRPNGSWCAYFKYLFRNESKILPYNVSFGESNADMIKENSMPMGNCLGSSSPRSAFTMNNFQEVKVNLKYYVEGSHESKIGGYVIHDEIPWEERDRVPVFRGRLRLQLRNVWKNNPEANCPEDPSDLGHRMKAAVFSLQHPDLFNGAVAFQRGHPCLIHNKTSAVLQTVLRMNGLGKGLPPLSIDPAKYYTHYQTTVVLGGIGAAFRTAKHMSAGQAIVLQKFDFEEWFVPYMEEYVHYIPLRQDLSDMKQQMEWIRENPTQVREIADNGRKFYWDYMSFGRNEEHWYELLWRLGEAMHEKGHGGSSMLFPWVYQRDQQGAWNLSSSGN